MELMFILQADYNVFKGDLDDDYCGFSPYRNSVISILVAQTNSYKKVPIKVEDYTWGTRTHQHPLPRRTRLE